MVHPEYESEFKDGYFRVGFIQDGTCLDTAEIDNNHLDEGKGTVKLIFTKRLKFRGHKAHQTGFENYDEWFGVFTHETEDGNLNFGYVHYVPSGYSSYTYEPEITANIYVDYSWEKFLRLGLPGDLREIVEKRILVKPGKQK